MTQALTHFIQSYGVLAVILLMAAESCAFPFPSEVIMPVAGLLAGLGKMSLLAAILGGTLGSLLGSLVAFGLAARFGEPLLLGPGRWVGFSRAHLTLATGWFQRHGASAAFFGRVLPVVRTYVSFPAGLARVDLRRFAVLTLAGSLIWCTALAALGDAVGANYTRVAGGIARAAILIAVIVAVALVAWFVKGRRSTGGPTAA
ncbi:MAG TPA: DedA family protein [Candidatus Dormibacteraeota bacterium]|nr:DedA family protein [Candidatus Dormibacteraeota bacterium]